MDQSEIDELFYIPTFEPWYKTSLEFIFWWHMSIWVLNFWTRKEKPCFGEFFRLWQKIQSNFFVKSVKNRQRVATRCWNSSNLITFWAPILNGPRDFGRIRRLSAAKNSATKPSRATGLHSGQLIKAHQEVGRSYSQVTFWNLNIVRYIEKSQIGLQRNII